MFKFTLLFSTWYSVLICWWSLPVGFGNHLIFPWLNTFSYFIFIWTNLNLLFQRRFFFSWLKADSLIQTLMSVSSSAYIMTRLENWGKWKEKCLIIFFTFIFYFFNYSSSLNKEQVPGKVIISCLFMMDPPPRLLSCSYMWNLRNLFRLN